MTEAQKKAKAKYQKKVKRIVLEFYPTEADLIEQIEKQPQKQTYIKNLIRADIERKEECEIYLIYRDSQDDYCEFKGYIFGSEKEADDYCESLNKNRKYAWEEYYYELLEKLNQ